MNFVSSCDPSASNPFILGLVGPGTSAMAFAGQVTNPQFLSPSLCDRDRWCRARGLAHAGRDLGLHIAKTMVELANGSIAYTGGETGARFTVRYPLVAASVDVSTDLSAVPD